MTVKIKKYYPYILLGLSFIILIVRCFISFCWSDETFYFATCYRFYQGDSMFLHEWFPTQLSSIVLLPLFSLYMLIAGSTTGIILYFRILFVIFSLINATVMFRILKQHTSELIALICSLMLMFYTHLNIGTLSYYTLSVQLFVMTMLLLYHFYLSQSKLQLIIAGILFAVCVLSLPTLSIAYFLVLFVIGILLLLARFSKIKPAFKNAIMSAQLDTIVIYTFIGILIPAVIFFAFLLTNVSVMDFIKGIPYVLSDEEHGTSFFYPIRKFFIGINEVYDTSAYLAYLLILLSFAFQFFRTTHCRMVRVFVFAADCALFIDLFLGSLGHTGYIQTALCLFALPLFFLLKRKDFPLFFTFIVSGMIFSLVYSYSSNGYLYILSMGHFVASIGCLIIIYCFAVEMLTEPGTESGKEISVFSGMMVSFGPVCIILSYAIIMFSLTQTMTLRMINIYRDAPVKLLTKQISEGPAKGLYTTADHLQLYNEVYDTLENYCQSNSSDKANTIFITKLLPWGYMCTDLRCAAPTTWRTAFNSVRLEPYYEMNPDRYPDLILVLDEHYGTYDTCGDVEYDPTPNENEIDGYLKEYVSSADYEALEVPCGILYRRK